MITKAAKLVNDATRGRWSTVVLLTLIFTIMRGVAEWPSHANDPSLFAAKVFAMLIISAIVSFVIHVVLYVVFSPKPIDSSEVFEKPVGGIAELEATTKSTAAQSVIRVPKKVAKKAVKKKVKKR